MADTEVMAKFYVIDGEIPILIGNDIFEELGCVVHTDLRKVEFKSLSKEIQVTETAGGHFVILLRANTIEGDRFTAENCFEIADTFLCEDEADESIIGVEADDVMLVMLSQCEE